MAFPTTALPLHVYLAAGVDPQGDSAAYVWDEITNDVRVADGVVIEQGRGDEAGQVDAGKCTLTINNRDGEYSPRNPLSPWYPDLKRNTPLRVTVEALRDNFNRTRLVEGSWGTTSDTGGTWSHTSTGATHWQVTGAEARYIFTTNNVVDFVISNGRARDLDATYRVRNSAVITGSSLVTGFMARYVDSNNFLLFRPEFNSGGTLTAKISRVSQGSFTELASLNPIPSSSYTASSWVRVRVQVEGPDLRMKMWPDGGTEPSTWTLTASDSSVARPGRTGFYYWLLAGNTNTYPMNVDVDDAVVEAYRFMGNVPEWPVRWDKSGNDSYVSVTAGGRLRQLGQGQAALRSPIYDNLSSLSPVGYWPFEDSSGASVASSVVNAARPAVTVGVTFAGDTTALPGARSTISVTDTSSITGRVAAHTATGAWGVVLYVQLDSLPAAETPVFEFASTGTQRRWRVGINSGGWSVNAWDASDTNVVSITSGFGPDSSDIPVGRFVAVYLQVESNGAGGINYMIERHGVGQSAFWQTNFDVAASVPGSPTTFVITGSTGLNGGRLGHLFVRNQEINLTDPNFINSSNGHIGETAAARVTRLCGEAGLPALVEAVTGTADLSEPMGRQLSDTLLGNLRSCEAADGGVLYEQGHGIGYQPRYVRYNPTVNLILNFASGHVSEAPEPTDDDQRTRNDWTVSRPNGGESQVTDDDHIAAYGRYDDSADINIATDERLPDHASWRVHLGTLDELRWPHIAMNIAARPTLSPIWMSLRIGSRITISNVPSQLAGTVIDVLLEGYTERLSYYDWTVDMNCSPSTSWLIAAVDDSAAVLDTEDTETNADIFDTDTTVDVWTNAGPLWTTAAANFPFDVDIGGERCTVTNITGTSNPQTMTITRSVNGIVKDHPQFTPVRLWRPKYIAL